MRIENSIRNIYMGIITQIIITLLGFISRRVFLDSLGMDYLGLNGLLVNVLSMLSLVEGGIGTSIIYSLYKPLAQNNQTEVIALVQLYKKLYGVIALLVGGLSLLLYPFLNLMIENSSTIPYITIVYFIFIFRNIISYLNAHKWSLINADQKGYVLARYDLFFNIFTTILKIIVLKITANYVLYLSIELVVIIIQNIWNGRIVNRLYPYIKTNKKYLIDLQFKKELFKNVKAIFLHNFGSYCVFGTDNILITMLINLKTVGLYSNYTMIINQLTGLLTPCINGIGASIGNLIATENSKKTYDIFRVLDLINFWIYGVVVIVLYNVLEPFIDWWLGDGFRLDNLTFLVILLNFYITGLRGPISIFKEKAGVFTNDQYCPLIESAINLGGSIILANYLGLAGIFLGTTISTLVIPFWVQPKLVYNKVFNRSVTEYFIIYIGYLLIIVSGGIATTFVCSAVTISNLFLSLVVKGLICLVIVNLFFIICLYQTKEFKYIIELLKLFIFDNNKILKWKRA